MARTSRKSNTEVSSNSPAIPESEVPSKSIAEVLREDLATEIYAGRITDDNSLRLFLGGDDVPTSLMAELHKYGHDLMSEKLNKEGSSEMTETTTPETTEVSANSEATNSEPTPEVPAFDIPANWRDLDLSDREIDPDTEDDAEIEEYETAQLMTNGGRKILRAIGKIRAIDAKLRTSDEKNSETAVLMFAESDAASEQTKAIFQAYKEAQAQMAKALAALTSQVKSEQGDVELSESQMQDLRTERGKLISVAKHLREMLDETAKSNNLEKTAQFLAAVEIPGARKSSGRKSRGDSSGSYNSTTSARPQLGANGFIAIEPSDGPRVTFPKFSDAQKYISAKLGHKSVTTGDIHAAWTSAANSKLGTDLSIKEWEKFPADLEFQVDGVPVKIHKVAAATS